MLLVLLTVAMTQVGPPGKGAPAPWETAKLYFLAGDLARAQDWAHRCVRSKPKICKPLNAAIAEYAFLEPHADAFTPAQARQYLELDRAIAPDAIGKLTVPARERYVLRPLGIAGARLDRGDRLGAQQIADLVREIDPHAPELAELDARLKGNRPDAGP